MKNLYDELLATFPEIASNVREAEIDTPYDAPYLAMECLVEWLNTKGECDVNEDTIRRLSEFVEWCPLQPRGETASDDLSTILMVAFVENLLLHDRTKWLIARLLRREYIEASREYFVAWVGRENYDRALTYYT